MNRFLLLCVVSLLIAPAAHASLKKSDMESIAMQYGEALRDKDFQRWQSMLVSTEGWDEDRFINRLRSDIKEVSVVDIDKRKDSWDILIKFVEEQKGHPAWTHSYWIQVLPNGKIKYDARFIQHPINLAMGECIYLAGMAHDEQKVPEDSLLNLKKSGIPLFDYSPNVSPSGQLDALEDIRRWLIKQGDEWDLTNPKIPYPEQMYDSMLKALPWESTW